MQKCTELADIDWTKRQSPQSMHASPDVSQAITACFYEEYTASITKHKVKYA